MANIKKIKKADLEMEQLGKLLLAIVGLVILIYIVTVVISGEFGSQSDKVKDVFNLF